MSTGNSPFGPNASIEAADRVFTYSGEEEAGGPSAPHAFQSPDGRRLSLTARELTQVSAYDPNVALVALGFLGEDERDAVPNRFAATVKVHVEDLGLYFGFLPDRYAAGLQAMGRAAATAVERFVQVAPVEETDPTEPPAPILGLTFQAAGRNFRQVQEHRLGVPGKTAFSDQEGARFVSTAIQHTPGQPEVTIAAAAGLDPETIGNLSHPFTTHVSLTILDQDRPEELHPTRYRQAVGTTSQLAADTAQSFLSVRLGFPDKPTA
ncbi:MAG TPA: hypothetical protein VK674_02810 [Candidatus Limnocylindria bacterium]|nr:hypothetical protein [Candidatus Limnocylindria bacterium]